MSDLRDLIQEAISPMRLRPDLLEQVVEAVQAEYVLAEDAETTRLEDLHVQREEYEERLVERYEAGKQRMRTKHAELSKAAEDLRVARGFVERALSWTGRPDWKGRVLKHLDEKINYYEP